MGATVERVTRIMDEATQALSAATVQPDEEGGLRATSVSARRLAEEALDQAHKQERQRLIKKGGTTYCDTGVGAAETNENHQRMLQAARANLKAAYEAQLRLIE